jgi:hypothetical protein
MELCRNLRWKSITRDLDDPDEIVGAFARNSVPYTCLQTCRSCVTPSASAIDPRR